MFDKFELLMSWKLSCFFASVMDTFSSNFQIIAHMWDVFLLVPTFQYLKENKVGQGFS